MARPPAAALPPGLAFASAFVAELAGAGVRDACVSPGSRSTPLVLALHAEPRIRVTVHLDERSAGFFALGLARAGRRPVALVCTSGTAAAGYLPAVVEAGLTRVPLVVLTADRPPELRGWGAPQTIDQSHLYGTHVRWFQEAPVPDGSPERLRDARALAARAVAVATAPAAGAVHLNLPFREPLAPEPGAWPGRAAEDPPEQAPRRMREWRAPARPDPEGVLQLAARAARTERGVLACGPLDDPDAPAAIAELGRAWGWPVLADPTSQLRRGRHVNEAIVAHGDLLLSDPRFARAHPPELVIAFGAPPTSKAFHRWLERTAPPHRVLVDPEDGFRDPSREAHEVFRCAPAALCDALGRRHRGGSAASGWLDAFRRADARAAACLAREVDDDPALLAAATVRIVGETVPDDTVLYVSNSMAVRDLDAYLPAGDGPLRVLANRGANGIDGMVSSALGAATAGAPTVLLTGDLALLHDLGGLLSAAGRAVPLTVVVANDDGGGIFSHLPVARLGADAGFEALFRTPHGRDLGALVRGLGLSHVRATQRAHLRAALKDGLGRREVSLIEVPVDPERNLAQHRRVREAVTAALAEPGP